MLRKGNLKSNTSLMECEGVCQAKKGKDSMNCFWRVHTQFIVVISC